MILRDSAAILGTAMFAIGEAQNVPSGVRSCHQSQMLEYVERRANFDMVAFNENLCRAMLSQQEVTGDVHLLQENWGLPCST